MLCRGRPRKLRRYLETARSSLPTTSRVSVGPDCPPEPLLLGRPRVCPREVYRPLEEKLAIRTHPS